MKINKAFLVISYIFSILGLLGCVSWMLGYAYNPKHPAWSFWVVPLQQTVFYILLGTNIVVVIIMVIPDDWFTDWADSRLKEIKGR